MLKQETKL